MSLFFQRLFSTVCGIASLVVLLAPLGSVQAYPAQQAPPANPNAARISGGVSHTCALTATGGVTCWGQGNRLGQAEDADDSAAPVPVVGVGTGSLALAAGNEHTCALTATAGVVCWSDNTFNQLGDGTTTFRAQPTAVAGLTNDAIALGAGDQDTCSVLANGGVSCWGANDFGALGDGTTTDRAAPVAVVGLGGSATAVTLRYGHACALLTSGGVTCWGRGLEGERGDGTERSSTTPVMVSGLAHGAIAIAAGTLHTCAALTNGTVKCWGQDDGGELGDGAFGAADRLKPVAVLGLTDPVTAITAGNAHTCVLTSVGGVKCWGTNDHGQLGDGTTVARNKPVNVVGLTSGVVAIGAGYEHTCALLANGTIDCWGDNAHGQLGAGTHTQRLTPVRVLYRIWLPTVTK